MTAVDLAERIFVSILHSRSVIEGLGSARGRPRVRTAGRVSTAPLLSGADAFWKELSEEDRKLLTALMQTNSTRAISMAYSTAVVPSCVLMSRRNAAVVCPIPKYRAQIREFFQANSTEFANAGFDPDSWYADGRKNRQIAPDLVTKRLSPASWM